MSSPATQTHPFNNFDAIRLLGALCVLFSHQFALTGRGEPSILGVHSIGGLGVMIFFTVSGYLVAKSWQADPHILRFTVRRMLRVWPGYAVAIVAVAALLGPAVSDLPLRAYFADPRFWHYFHNLTFNLVDGLPMAFTGNVLPVPTNGSLWTIPQELRCYVALAVVGLVGGFTRWGKWVVTVALLTVVFRFAVWEPRGAQFVAMLGWPIMKQFLGEFSLFFAAGACYHLLRMDRAAYRWKIVLACLLLAGTALWWGRNFLALWLAVPALVLAVGNSSTPVLRRAGRWGDVSFGLYIYAFPVQQTLIWLAKGRLPWVALLALTVLVTLLLALFSWHCIEKRALRFKPANRRAMPQAATLEMPQAA